MRSNWPRRHAYTRGRIDLAELKVRQSHETTNIEARLTRVALNSKEDETHDGNQTSAVRKKPVNSGKLATFDKGLGPESITYRKPVAKIAITLIFLIFFICSLQITTAGITTIQTSSAAFTAEYAPLPSQTSWYEQ